MLKARLICWILNLVSNDWEARIETRCIGNGYYDRTIIVKKKALIFVGHKCPTYGINNAYFGYF